MSTRPQRLVVVVPAEAAGSRLDRVLGRVPGVGTRAQARRLFDEGRVLLDGVPRKPAHVVRGGERLEVDLPPPPPTGIEPQALPLAVLYEDDAVLAIDKPPGMVVHPGAGVRAGTVVNALVHRLGTLAGVGPAERPGIVHRLDRDTSGVLLIARTAQALEALARQFRERSVRKRYLALVHGRLEPDAGSVDRPIGRHPVERKRMAVRRGGRQAITHWRVRERLPGTTLLELEPETGRTHQLRVHLAALGHPIVGDPIYGRPVATRGVAKDVVAVLAACPRLALHAAGIGFQHPSTGRSLTIVAPCPPDLVPVLMALRRFAHPGAAAPACDVPAVSGKSRRFRSPHHEEGRPERL